MSFIFRRGTILTPGSFSANFLEMNREFEATTTDPEVQSACLFERALYYQVTGRSRITAARLLTRARGLLHDRQLQHGWSPLLKNDINRFLAASRWEEAQLSIEMAKSPADRDRARMSYYLSSKIVMFGGVVMAVDRNADLTGRVLANCMVVDFLLRDVHDQASWFQDLLADQSRRELPIPPPVVLGLAKHSIDWIGIALDQIDELLPRVRVDLSHLVEPLIDATEATRAMVASIEEKTGVEPAMLQSIKPKEE